MSILKVIKLKILNFYEKSLRGKNYLFLQAFLTIQILYCLVVGLNI